MQEFKVDGHEPSLLPEGKKWEYVWGDEFDGDTLDMSKWSFRLNFWGRRFLPYTDQGVELDGNSNVKIHLIEKDGQYMSAQLQTGANSFDAPAPVYETETNVCGDNFFWKIGDIEKPKFSTVTAIMRCAVNYSSSRGWWSAFWLQSPSIGMSYDPDYSGVEVDVMENFTRDGEVTSGNIFGGYGTNLQHEARVPLSCQGHGGRLPPVRRRLERGGVRVLLRRCGNGAYERPCVTGGAVCLAHDRM